MDLITSCTFIKNNGNLILLIFDYLTRPVGQRNVNCGAEYMFSSVDSVLVSCGCVMAVRMLGQFCLRNGMIINRWCGRLAICRSFRRNKRRGIVCR